MKIAFLSKNKIKFINGKLLAPQEDDHLLDTWERSNNVVLSWIYVSLSHDIAQSTIYVENATKLWMDLQNCFSKTDHFCLSYLLQQIHSMSQGDKFVNAYLNELKTLWKDFETLRVLPNWNYGAHTTIKKKRDMESVICFLKGLNDNFNNVKSQILIIDPLLDVTKVFSSILQDER